MDIATKICFTEKSVQFNEDSLHDLQPAEEEGINVQYIPIACDVVSTDISDSESEDKDQEELDLVF